jgi:hypothetical protein
MRMPLKALFANLLSSPRILVRHMLAAPTLSEEDEAEMKALSAWLAHSPAPLLRPDAKVVMIVSLLPLPYCMKMEMLMARALMAKGYRVMVLTNQSCRAMACAYHGRAGGLEVRLIESYASIGSAARARHELSELLASEEDLLTRMKAYRYREAFSGLHSLATLSSMIKDGSAPITPANRSRLRRTLTQSISLSDAATAALADIRPALVLGLEKGFVGTTEIFYAALSANLDYVQWTSCHEPNSIMLKRYRWDNCRDHPFSISDSAWQKIRALPWNNELEQAVMQQFERGYLEGAWFKYKNLSTDQDQIERRELMKRLGLDESKKTVIIYSHILNDANLFYGQDVFAGGFAEWLIETVRAAKENTEVNWVLKLHPANVYRNAKLGYTGQYGELLALEGAFGAIPNFLRIVYPEDKTSPLSFFKITDVGITVRGTVGLELPCFGVPVLTAGTGRYAGKGFTIDSANRKEYLERIQGIHRTPPLEEAQRQLGLRYAYFVFHARPARYGEMFSDVYNFPLKHPRHRDILLGGKPINILLDHPQMQKIAAYLCSDEEDFLDIPATETAKEPE